jgi:hypothetical protein
MQQMLLNKDQLVLFNFFPKEIIRASEEKIELGRDKILLMYAKGLKHINNTVKNQSGNDT